ncbi:hypothetical protein GCM10027278_33660 [Paralcaligenes ginsengisoli]
MGQALIIPPPIPFSIIPPPIIPFPIIWPIIEAPCSMLLDSGDIIEASFPVDVAARLMPPTPSKTAESDVISSRFVFM